MRDIRGRWLTFDADYVEPAMKEMFGYVEKMIVATLIISAAEHVAFHLNPEIRSRRIRHPPRIKSGGRPS